MPVAGLGRPSSRSLDATLPAPERAALRALLERPRFELLPLKHWEAQVDALPPGVSVAVTASPSRGLEATVALAAAVQARGWDAVPHLAARMVRDRDHLADLLAQLAAGSLTRAFVVAGDAATPGAYPDGLALLRAIEEVGPRPAAIGLPCYPDGHAFVSDAVLLDALRAKLPHAAWLTTQLCFDPGRITGWIAARRGEGIAVPILVGVPGVTEPHRLLTIGARIGVRDTRRFVQKNLGLVGRLARSGGFYRPDALLAGLAPAAADPSMGIAGLHLYTFNQVAATDAWRREALARL